MKLSSDFRLLTLLCSSLALCHAVQTNDFSLLPVCAEDCMNDTFSTTTCRPLSSSNTSCACQDVAMLDRARICITTTCAPKDGLRALDTTFEACNDRPIRDKSVSYRHVNLVFYILAVVAILAHWFVRYAVGRLRWLDDGNMVMVLAFGTLLFVVCHKMSFTGLGVDMWNVPFSDITTTLLYFWISEIAYFVLIGFIKISFLLFFLQIFPDKRFRQIVWVIICIQLALMLVFGCAAAFLCTPISFVWNQWDGEHTGTCINNNVLAFTHAAHSIFFDFVTLSLPITQIWKLHMGLKKKIGVLLMFSVGAFVTVVSVLRLQSLVTFANATDITWDYLQISLWSVIECQVGIICTCMPSIRLGLSRLFPMILGSTNQSTTKNTPEPSARSRGFDTLGDLIANEINVQTTFRVSHTKKPHTTDDERSFVQLVEIDADSKSANSST